jgi:hypothetical protein
MYIRLSTNYFRNNYFKSNVDCAIKMLRCFSIFFRTGEEFASRLAKEGARYGLKGIVADPEECDMEELTQVIKYF